MQFEAENIYKREIRQSLMSAKDQVVHTLRAVGSDSGWKDIHAKTEIAIMQLRKATRLLAQYNLIAHEAIGEIVKTYRYLN